MKIVFLEATAGRRVDPAPGPARSSAWRCAAKALSGQILATLKEWRHRSHARIELAKLDDRMLRDIGVNRAEIWREVNKPFWRK